MHPKTLAEYISVRHELSEIQECITTWMDMFYKLVVASLGAIGAAALFVFSSDSHSGTIHTDLLAFIGLVAACYAVLMFSTIIIHKCNTHNRYAGYARAMVREQIGRGAEAERVAEIRLWDGVLAWSPQKSSSDEWTAYETSMAQAKAAQPEAWATVTGCDERCRDIFALENVRKTIRACVTGWWMLLRATVQRYPTKSWTFTYQVGFGPFLVTTVFFFSALGIYFNHGFWISQSWPGVLILGFDILPIIMFIALGHLFASWCGIFYRVFRLCHDDGDRTIEYYHHKFVLLRWLALNNRGIAAKYVAWP